VIEPLLIEAAEEVFDSFLLTLNPNFSRLAVTHQASCGVPNIDDKFHVNTSCGSSEGLHHARFVRHSVIVCEMFSLWCLMHISMLSRVGPVHTHAFWTLVVFLCYPPHALELWTQVVAKTSELDRVFELHLAFRVHESLLLQLLAPARLRSFQLKRISPLSSSALLR
jgi:hypothetical protein